MNMDITQTLGEGQSKL